MKELFQSTNNLYIQRINCFQSTNYLFIYERTTFIQQIDYIFNNCVCVQLMN